MVLPRSRFHRFLLYGDNKLFNDSLHPILLLGSGGGVPLAAQTSQPLSTIGRVSPRDAAKQPPSDLLQGRVVDDVVEGEVALLIFLPGNLVNELRVQRSSSVRKLVRTRLRRETAETELALDNAALGG